MKRITRNIEPSEARDLLGYVPRACVAFAGDQGLQAEPVTVVFKNERYLVGMPSSRPIHPPASEEIVLLIDEGYHFFDLRAVYIRGRVEPASEEDLPSGFSWFAVAPAKVVAWDYGRRRTVDAES
jgi:hypothetical protein